MDENVEDRVLVARAQQGHLDAFETLVQRYSVVAYRVALRILGDHHDAQDVAQEALLSAWRNLASFRAESAFSTWFYQIVTRAALNRRTRGQRGDTAEVVEVADTLPAATDGPSDSITRKQSAAAVTAAVAALPAPQRVAVVLHHFEGLSYADVAAVTASSVPAVRSHLFRARRTLAAALGQWR